MGLASDYAVLVLTRIKEAHDAGNSNTESVAIGLERTGRIVTQAALLFCVAIGAFSTSSIIFIKEVGIGTAVAVIIDASVVRALPRAVADGAAGRVELVGSRAAAQAAPTDRTERGIEPVGGERRQL